MQLCINFLMYTYGVINWKQNRSNILQTLLLRKIKQETFFCLKETFLTSIVVPTRSRYNNWVTITIKIGTGTVQSVTYCQMDNIIGNFSFWQSLTKKKVKKRSKFQKIYMDAFRCFGVNWRQFIFEMKKKLIIIILTNYDNYLIKRKPFHSYLSNDSFSTHTF